jgi:hypothetical protein
MWLCQEVASLQSKWDFYLELFGKEQNTNLLSELARFSFNIVEESLRFDMIMAICRLSDPLKSVGQENLSFARLVENCSDVSGLDVLRTEFQKACEPVRQLRNKRVGHKDLNTFIKPSENPLAGIDKEHMDLIVKLASNILKAVFQHYVAADVDFHTIARGGAKDLIFWLNEGREFHVRKFQNNT